MPAGAVDADHPKQVEREILRMDVRCQRAIDAHAHVARAALADRLRREHMFDFRGSDPEGERPESARSEEHTSELQSLMRISYAVFCLKKKTTQSASNLDTT